MADNTRLKRIVEALLMATDGPLGLEQLQKAFDETETPDKADLRAVLDALAADYADSAVELVQVASGYRFQVGQDWSPWVRRMASERPGRYSRALLETLALIAYRQPITRGEIEEIRGVSVSSNIMRTLQERDWIRSVGQRDVPGRPTLYGTTRTFLDYFNLGSLEQLPTLMELRDFESINAELDFGENDEGDRQVKPSTEAAMAGDAAVDEAPDSEEDEPPATES